MPKISLLKKVNYDSVLTEVVKVNILYHQQYDESPTIAKVSEIIGITEEKVLESMEYGDPEIKNMKEPDQLYLM